MPYPASIFAGVGASTQALISKLLVEAPSDRLSALSSFKNEIFFEGCEWDYRKDGDYVVVNEEPPGFDKELGDLDVFDLGTSAGVEDADWESFKNF